MKLDLQLRLRQTIAPQLIQSLKMLQMPILRLEQLVRQELSVNPMLEEVETAEDTETSTPESSEDNQDPQLDKIDWQEYLGEDHEYNYSRLPRDREEFPEKAVVVEETLYEHLSEQLNLSRLASREKEIAEYIIGNIDENGFLTIPAKEISLALDASEEEILKVLAVIQKFDPVSVGARDLRECLLIQLQERGLKGSLAYRIVAEHLSQLDKKSQQQLSHIVGVSPIKVEQAMEVIRSLNPRPAHGGFSKAAIPIVPDLTVERLGDELVVFHNDRNVPHLRVNTAYRELLRKGKSSEDTKKYIREKLEQARWLVNAINQRRTTMGRVMEAIVEQQGDFFESGPEHLKPMTMESIAEKVEMNVATISRVASGKYVQTPMGVFEIRYFFNSGMTTDDGEELTKRAIKRRLEEIIKNEDLRSPLSDQEIANLLKEEGLSIARRTVTKYREELKIMPARFRKKVRPGPREKEQGSGTD